MAPMLFDGVDQIRQFSQYATQRLDRLSFDNLELVMHYCRQLKMIRVDGVHFFVESRDHPRPPSPVQSVADISQCLSSVDLGVHDEVHGRWEDRSTTDARLSSLLTNLGYCASLRDISFVPALVRNDELSLCFRAHSLPTPNLPIFLDVTGALSERPELWNKITTLSLLY